MAEGFLRKYLEGEEGLEIISAGTAAIDGLNYTAEAIEAMKEEEIDILSGQTKAFSKELAEFSDIILVMGQVHKNFLLDLTPDLNEKIYLYKEFAGIEDYDKDIIDPIGQSISVYRTIRDDIKKASAEIARKIKELNNRK